MGKNLPEGIRRLSIFSGGVCGAIFATWLAMETGFTDVHWLNAIVGLVFSYAAGWVVVRAIYWVYCGFVAGKGKS